jgi:hypothetical protein
LSHLASGSFADPRSCYVVAAFLSPEPMKRRRLRQAASPYLVNHSTRGTKISHLFKRLTLSAGAHFVNSLPLEPAGVFNRAGHCAAGFFASEIDPILGKTGNGNEMKNCVDMENSILLGCVFLFGAVAQLGERMTGSHEVRGSIPLSSTKKKKRGTLNRAAPFLLVQIVYPCSSSACDPWLVKDSRPHTRP